MCNDNLDDIVNKYNKTYHNTIKMNPVDIKSNTYIESSEKTNNKYPEFKIGDIVRISNIKIFLQKITLQIDLKKILRLKKLNLLLRGHI